MNLTRWATSVAFCAVLHAGLVPVSSAGPVIEVTPPGLTNITVNAGGVSNLLLTITNQGDADLVFTVTVWHIGANIITNRHLVTTNFSQPRSVAAGDIDDDGDTDLAAVGYGAGQVAWWENTDGSGTSWVARIVCASFAGGTTIDLEDFDDDGNMDITAAAGASIHEIRWWENTSGVGTNWVEHLVTNFFWYPQCISAADVNRDGDMDVVGAGSFHNEILWCENATGDGTSWIERRADGSFSGAYGVHAADVDGDNRTDILGAALYADDIAWWRNTTGAGTSWTEYTIEASLDGAICVYATNMDGDADVDVLAAAQNADAVTWWENLNGAGTSWQRHDVYTNFDGARCVHAEDLDGDGDMDVLAAAETAGDVVWWEDLDGEGTNYAEHVIDSSYAGATWVRAVDVNGDGLPDVAATSASSNTVAWWENERPVVCPDWLTVAVTSGVVAAGGSTNIIVTFLATNVPPGDHRETFLHVLSNDGSAPTSVVPCSMDVVGADLVIASITTSNALALGQRFDLVYVLANNGNVTAAPSAARFLLSTNTTLDAPDADLGTDSGPALGPGTSWTNTVRLFLPGVDDWTAGTNVLLAEADAADVVPEGADETNNVSASSPITVYVPDLLHIDVYAVGYSNDPTVALGYDVPYVCLATYAFDYTNDSTAGATWHSSDTNVVRMSPSTPGLAETVGTGTSLVEAVFQDMTSSPPRKVIVTDAVVTNFTTDPLVASAVQAGTTQEFDAVEQYSDGTEIEIVPDLWRCSDTNIGVLDADGLFSALAAGTAAVDAVSGAVTSQAAQVEVLAHISGTVTVTGAPLAEAVVCYSGPIEATVTSGVGGTYQTPWLPAGAYELWAAHTSCVPSLKYPAVLGPNRTNLDLAVDAAPVIGLSPAGFTGLLIDAGTASNLILTITNAGKSDLSFSVIGLTNTYAAFFTRHTVDTDFAGAMSVFAGDLDGDTDQDVLGAAYARSEFAWWENTDGAGTNWIKHVLATNADGANGVHAADLDGDLDLDVLGAVYQDSDMTWWENADGSGTNWIEHLVDDNCSGAYDVYAADVDGDLHLDPLAAAARGYDILWWANVDGTGTNTALLTVDGDFINAYSVHASDMNDDTKMDALGASYGSDDMTWWENTDGAGTNWIEHTVDGSFDGASSILAADVDGDGDEDVAGTAENAAQVAWWENTDGAGTNWVKHVVATGFRGASSVCVTDVDEDGCTDLLAVAKRGAEVAWWQNVGGSGTNWLAHTVDDDAHEPSSLCARDVDGDGDDDILVAEYGAAYASSAIAWWEQERLCVSDLLHFAQTSGALSPGSSTGIVVTFDATGLPAGYHAEMLLWFVSDDVLSPTSTLPVSFDVPAVPVAGPAVTVGPGSISVTNLLGGSTNRLLAIGNTGDVTLVFSLSKGETNRSLLAAGGGTAGDGSDEDELVLAYAFGRPDIISDGTYDRVRVAGADEDYRRAGAPIVPVQPVSILVPCGRRVASLHVTADGRSEWPGEFYLAPAQAPCPLDASDAGTVTPPDPVIYSQRTAWPGPDHEMIGVHAKRGYRVLTLNLFPVQYVPATRRVSSARELRIEVEFADAPEARIARTTPATERLLASRVANPGGLATYRAPERHAALTGTGSNLPPGGPFEYVVITSARLNNTPGPWNFQALCDAKIARGLSAGVVTSEWIYARYDGTRPDGGEDDPTRLRNFLIDAYQVWGTRYALLAGVASNLQPREFFVRATRYTSALIPADMYFGCVDPAACTFDGDGDGKYGEPNDGADGGDVDLFADIYVGRATVANAAEVSNFVYKTLSYAATTNAYLAEAAMLGEHLGFGGEAEYAKPSMEEIRLGGEYDGYFTYGFENHVRADLVDLNVDTNFYAQDGLWGKFDIADKINEGVHLLNHLGHAAHDDAMHLATDELYLLTNDLYFFAYSQGCDPGGFSGPDCLAEEITAMEHGAFAVIMNAHTGWGKQNDTDSPSQRFDRQFWNVVLGDGILELGRAHQAAKEANLWDIYGDEMRWCYYELNLFGDPEQAFRISTDSEWLVLAPETGTVAAAGSTNVTVSLLAGDLEPGTYEGEIVVSCNDTSNRSVSIPVRMFVQTNLVPVAQILGPLAGEFVEHEAVWFSGAASDPEDGVLTNLAWISSLDGGIGSGTGVLAATLSAGIHTIRLDAVDARSLTGCAFKTIWLLADADTNGLPDEWQTNRWPSGDSGGGSNDWDKDEFSNFDEWLADSDPTNPLSYFRVRGLARAPGGAGSVLDWHGRSNRCYVVEGRTGAVYEVYLPPTILAPAGDGTISYTDAVHGAEGRAFYRLRVGR